MPPTASYAGADGCRAGWIVIQGSSPSAFKLDLLPTLDAICTSALQRALIDMPIGLPEQEARTCDQEARALLGRPRSASVFSPPCRDAVHSPDYQTANQRQRDTLGKGLSIQSWNLAPRIREVDQLVRQSGNQHRLLESHPELCFAALNDGTALQHGKKTSEGREERIHLLRSRWESGIDAYQQALERFPRSQAQPDDLLDAMVLYLACTESIAPLTAIPDSAQLDRYEIPMQIVIPRLSA